MVDRLCRHGWRCTIYLAKPCLAWRIPEGIHGESLLGDVARCSFVHCSLRHSFRHGRSHAACRRILLGRRVLAIGDAFVFRRRGFMGSNQIGRWGLVVSAFRANNALLPDAFSALRCACGAAKTRTLAAHGSGAHVPLTPDCNVLSMTRGTVGEDCCRSNRQAEERQGRCLTAALWV